MCRISSGSRFRRGSRTLQAVEGALTATVTANGLETEVHAELQQPDGSWLSAGSVSAGSGTSALPVTLALRGLTPGRHAARVRATNAAGTATSATVELTGAQPPTDPPTDPPPAPPAPPAPTPTPTPTADPVPVQGKTVVLTAGSGHRPHQGAGPERLHDARRCVERAGRRAHRHHGGQRRAVLAGRRQDAVGHLRGRQVPRAAGTRRDDGADARWASWTAGPARPPRAAAEAEAEEAPRVGQDSGGRFQTHGKNSVATVRGTRWSTEDTCTGTRVRVTQGAVAVKPAGKRAVLVRAGHSSFTRHADEDRPRRRVRRRRRRARAGHQRAARTGRARDARRALRGPRHATRRRPGGRRDRRAHILRAEPDLAVPAAAARAGARPPARGRARARSSTTSSSPSRRTARTTTSRSTTPSPAPGT